MRLAVVLFASALALVPLDVEAQLYGSAATGGGYEVLYIDTRTGNTTTVAVAPTRESASASAADVAGGRYFLFYSSSFSTIDVRTGAVTQVPLSGGTHEFLTPTVYDPVTGRILGTRNAAGGSEIIAFDPHTGQVTALFRVPGRSPFDITLDAAGRRLFLIDAGDTLRIVQLDTGAVTTVTLNRVTAGTLYLEYDAGRNRLLTLSLAPFNLVAIDPVTGAVTTIAPVDVSQLVTGGFAFSPVSREVAFVAVVRRTNVPTPTAHLVVINVDSGTVRLLPTSGSLLQFIDEPLAIPTLQDAALLLLASFLGCVGLLALSRP